MTRPPGSTLPAPRTQPGVGHLGRWGTDPLGLLTDGAVLGPVFSLRLWRRAVVGYSPDWNRHVLGDLTTFRAAGSMSGLSPYLGAGVVQTDGPAHRARRRELNPPFARRAVAPFADSMAEVIGRHLPRGPFDAVAWSAAVVRDIIGSTLCAGGVPAGLLSRFLAPLDKALPAPFLPRPLLFRRMDVALDRAIATAPDGSLAAAFRGMSGGRDELRVAIAAGYDTTAHTLAFLLAEVAANPAHLDPDRREMVIDEVLRLYPAGWLGSRRAAADTEFDGHVIGGGTLVLYSPFLTHRDPGLWKDPLVFRPERFADPVPAWGHIPFAAGERTCLGRSFARTVLSVALAAFEGAPLRRLGSEVVRGTGGELGLRAGITLAPSGPIALERS